MQKIQKSKDPLLYEMQYKHIRNFKSWGILYLPMIAISLLLYVLKLYELIHPSGSIYHSVPFLTVFIVQICVLLVVIIVGCVSLFISSVNNIFVYMLLLVQALGMVYVQTTMQCFQKSQWCGGDIKLQVGALIIICLYAAVVYLRSTLYYPFYDNYNYLSMASSSIILFDFIYKLLFGIITNIQPQSNIESQRKLMILITIALYCIYNASKYYSNPLIHNCYLVVYTFLVWTTLVAYLLPYFDVISTMQSTYQFQTQTLFWYVWGYSTPCLIIYAIIANFSIDPKNGWKMLFLQKKHQIKDLEYLYLKASQLKLKLKYLKKSQQKTNDPLFKTIWGLIVKHNQFCDHTECPLQELKNIQIHRNDDYLEQKRLIKTIQCCYSFGLYHLQRKKDRSPNLLQLSVQIANYELQVFQNRQKGLVLYTQFYGKQDIDNNEKFMLYYLKKKIEQMFIDNENYTKTNTQNEISQFRHNIEVSVGMLAQFWYFLADPKCNLKKLYDLANVLFPLKIGVDNQWKNIQRLKNIESYNLYARYLIKMFNDKEKGLKILEQAKKIQQQLKNRQQVEVDAEGNTNIGVEENGIIFLEFDGKNPGVMYQVNLAAERIFGYNKGELTNRKVNDIMPKLFALYHDKILENYQQTNKAKMMNKSRLAWGKSKDGYLFPFTIMIKPVKNLLSQSSQVYASVKRQTWVKQSGFLTIDLQDQISEVSASMLGIFPQLYGKVNLKKKMHITQIIPNFVDLKQKMLDDKDGTTEFSVEREFGMMQKDKFKETTTFTLSMQDISFTVSGLVGYIVKFQKTLATSTTHKDSSSTGKDLSLSHIRQSKLKQNHFRFTYHITQPQPQSSEQQQQNNISNNIKKSKIRYQGGIVHDIDQLSRSCLTSASKFFTKLPVEQQRQIEQRMKIDYADGIRTKRLQNKQIREIHLISQQSQYDMAEQQKQLQQQMGYINIKPSELSSILQKQTSNKHITCLKLITLVILICSSLLCVIEYVNLTQQHTVMTNNNQQVLKLNQLAAEILYMKMFVTQFSLYQANQSEVELFTSEINLLDSYLNDYSYGVNTNLVSNDGSSQSMLLSFALSKLISSSNSINSYTTVYNQSDPNVFFVQYNTINGLYISTSTEITLAINNFYSCLDKITSIEIIYICVAMGVFLVALVMKNVLLRIVLKKKSQILEVFFEIPRKACTSIQKQCERFIQRLSSQNQQDLDSMSMASETSQAGFTQEKKKHKQKKRTVMGEQKTTNHYILATIGFLLILLFFHVFTTIYHQINKSNLSFTMQSSQQIYKLEQQVSLTVNLMNSFALNSSIPLLGNTTSNSQSIIQQQFNMFSQLNGDLPVKFYLIGNIFDAQYLGRFNQLAYEDLCQMGNLTQSQCSMTFGQNYVNYSLNKKGLNVILSQYFNIVKNKYLSINKFINNGRGINSTQQNTLLNITQLLLQRKQFLVINNIGQGQYLLKNHWRQLTSVVHQGQDRLVQQIDTIIFAIMLTMCVCNFTILLFCWIRFYHSLEQKIAATEYILTFIPIDEINRNPKIANYIKEEILEKR